MQESFIFFFFCRIISLARVFIFERAAFEFLFNSEITLLLMLFWYLIFALFFAERVSFRFSFYFARFFVCLFVSELFHRIFWSSGILSVFVVVFAVLTDIIVLNFLVVIICRVVYIPARLFCSNVCFPGFWLPNFVNFYAHF